MRHLKKYPNRRIYDTRDSQFITLADVRKIVISREPFEVVHSKTGEDLTRSVLLQIISELEEEGHEPLLTDRVLEELIRFYGDRTISMMAPFLEQQILKTIAAHNQLRHQLGKALNFPSAEQTIRRVLAQYQGIADRFLGGSTREEKPDS